MLNQFTINYLDISYFHGIIFAYLNHELKLLSIEKLSQYLENGDSNLSIDDLVTFKFVISSDVTQIKLNANESCLYVISQVDNEMVVSNIDTSILLNGTFNEHEVYRVPAGVKILRFMPSPKNHEQSVCLLDSKDLIS